MTIVIRQFILVQFMQNKANKNIFYVVEDFLGCFFSIQITLSHGFHV